MSGVCNNNNNNNKYVIYVLSIYLLNQDHLK